MIAMLTTAADAALAVLNAIQIPQGWSVVASRQWTPVLQRENMAASTVYLTVVPIQQVPMQATRGERPWNLEINIGIQASIADTTNASIDPVAAIAESVVALFAPGTLGSTGYQLAPSGPKIEGAFPIQGHINEDRVYTGIISITFTNWS